MPWKGRLEVPKNYLYRDRRSHGHVETPLPLILIFPPFVMEARHSFLKLLQDLHVM